MSQYDGSEDCWGDDLARERRPVITAQNLACARTAIKNGRFEIAAAALETAADEWDAYDAIGDHITDASTALAMAERTSDDATKTARYHARQAAQLLATQTDVSLTFSSGGEAR